MNRKFEGSYCPDCGKGVLKGNIKNKRKVNLKCSNLSCPAVYTLKRSKLGIEQEEILDEATVIPQGSFMNMAKRILLFPIAFGTENLTAKYLTHAQTGLPGYQLIWCSKSTDEMTADEQELNGIEPVRKITLFAHDPLWFKYGVVDKPELTKLANDEEITTLMKIMELAV